MNADKLAQALRLLVTAHEEVLGDGLTSFNEPVELRRAKQALAEYDAQPAQAAQSVRVTADLLRRIDVLCPSEGSYLSRMEWKAAKLNRMLAAAPQPPAQPNVIAPSVQTLPLKTAPYTLTTTARPSADAEGDA
jgi:hypothetical protein